MTIVDNSTVTTAVVVIYTVLIIITITKIILIIIFIVILIVASIPFVISKQVFSLTPVHSQGLMSLFVGHGQGVFKGRAGGRALNLHAGLFDCLLVYFSCSHTYWSIGEDFPTWLNQCRQRTYAWPLVHNGCIGRVTTGRPPTADLPIHAMLDWLSWGHMV